MSDDLPKAVSAPLTGLSLADRVLRAVWCLNIAALVGLCVWAYVDSRFGPAAYYLKADVDWLLGRRSGVAMGRSRFVEPRMHVLWWTLASVGASGLVLLGALFVGPRRHRRLWTWLAFTGLLAAWLAVFVTLPEIAWRGQQRRMRAELTGFEALAQSLREEWPRADGERPGLGPFMAYPVGKPSMIMLLTTPEVSPSGVSIAAVEHSPQGGLRFQLTGDERGTWLEWHPPGEKPGSFTGGLVDDHMLERIAALERGWFLVRYRRPRDRWDTGM
ncbi:MAG: hypothetical protein WD669_12460 [Pirellulales bacterium]